MHIPIPLPPAIFIAQSLQSRKGCEVSTTRLPHRLRVPHVASLASGRAHALLHIRQANDSNFLGIQLTCRRSGWKDSIGIISASRFTVICVPVRKVFPSSQTDHAFCPSTETPQTSINFETLIHPVVADMLRVSREPLLSRFVHGVSSTA